MMRSYAKVLTAIWSDPGFVALSAIAQRTYIMLLSQPDLRSTGVLQLSLKRLSRLAPDTTTGGISSDIDTLVRAGLVLLDEDTDELLIRTFLRHDGGFRNPNHRKTIMADTALIHSAALRGVVEQSLAELTASKPSTTNPEDNETDHSPSVQGMTDAMSDGIPDAMSDAVAYLPTANNQQPVSNNHHHQPPRKSQRSVGPKRRTVAGGGGLSEQDRAVAAAVDLAVSVERAATKSEIKSERGWRHQVRTRIAAEHGPVIAEHLAAGASPVDALTAVGYDRIQVAIAEYDARQNGGYL